MAQTQINGGTQIKPNTITLDRLIGTISIPTNYLTQGSLFALTTGHTMTGNIVLGGNKVTGSGAPSAAGDLVPKSYVDALVNGFTIHGVRLVSTVNVATLSGLLTVDGVASNANDILLLLAQSTASQNGPWVANSSTWTRPSWWASGAVIPEGNYFIADADGTNNKNTKWFVTNTGSITVDTTALTFTQDLSGIVYVNGLGLTLSGTTFAVNPGNGISVSSNAVTAVGDSTGLISVSSSGIAITAAGTAGQLILANTGTGKPLWQTMGGDATISYNGSVTVTKTNGVAFAPSATTDATNANNIASGTLATGRIAGSYTGITGVGVIAAGTWNAGTIGVAYGGTGATSLTAHGILLGEGTGAVVATAVGTNGQVLLGQSSADPAWKSLQGDVTVDLNGNTTINTTAGTGYLKYTNFIFDEVPGGTINGSNNTFTLANTPQVSSLNLTLNGECLRAGASYDYTISGTTITTVNYTPVSGDVLLADYIK